MDTRHISERDIFPLRLQLILSNLDGAILLVSKENKIEFANEAFCGMYGLRESPGDLLGLTASEMLEKIGGSYADPSASLAHIKELVSNNVAAHGEEVTLKGGRTCIRDFTPITVNGENYGRLWFHQDITERKQAEQYEQFRSGMLELLTGGKSTHDILEAIVRGMEQLHPAMICSILLLDSEGRHLGKGVAPSLPDFYNVALEGLEIGIGVGSCGTAAFTGERVIVEDIQTHPYWEVYRELAASAGLGACWSQPVRSSSGQVLGTFAVYHHEARTPAESDIYRIEESARLVSIAIEREQTEALLRQHERDLRSILNSVPAMIGYWDKNLRNRFGNHAYRAWFGIDESQMRGKHIREVIGEERYRLNLHYIEGALRGEHQVFERDIPAPDGMGTRRSLANYIPDLQDDEVRGFYVLVSDVTPLKQAQAELEKHRNHLEELVSARTSELEQSRDAAEAGNRAKTIFLANMSHELRTPMNGVIGMLDLVLRRATDPRQIDWLNKSKGAAQRMVDVVDDIIDFSKAEAERLPLEEKNFSLSRLIDDAIAMQDITAETKSLKLIREIPAAFPDLLSGDAFRLRQILLNLLGNACKFSDQGTITVRLSAEEQDGDGVLVRIEVEDQGIGISPEQQAMVFRAFTQVDGSMTRKYGGSGLGLILSKRLANLMGGDVGVVSQVGRGSTFWVTVRLKPAKTSEVGS